MDPIFVLLASFSAIFAWSERNNLVLPLLKVSWRWTRANIPGAKTHREYVLILAKLQQLEDHHTDEKLAKIEGILRHLKQMLAFNIAKKTLLENHIGAATFMMDEQGELVSCSAEYQKIVGMEIGSIKGTNWKNGIDPTDLQRYEENLSRAITDKRQFIDTTRFINRSTQELTCAYVHADPVKCDGELIGYVGSVRKVECSEEEKSDHLNGHAA